MPRQPADDAAPGRDGGPSEEGAERGLQPPSSAGPPSPPANALTSSSATTSPTTTTAPAAAGVKNDPSSDDAPVPLAQAIAAYDEAEKGKKKGVEEIVGGGDVPVPAAMMDTSYDAAEKGSGKGVELVDDDDEGPVPPGRTAEDGSDSKIDAKKDASDRAATRPADSIVEPAFEEDDDVERLRTISVPREDGRPQPFLMEERVRSPPPSMLPRDSTASDAAEPSPPILQARLVEDEPEQPVYDAVPVGEEHWAKRHQRKLVGGLVLVIVALVVALGVSFGTGGVDDDAADRTVISATASLLPTGSIAPSFQPTMSPSLEPSGKPSTPLPCFVDREELRAAVDAYSAGGIPCSAGVGSCEVTQKYGWPIGSWCTSNITDMSWMFHRKGAFNDDLSSWDTSSVTSMEYMFAGAVSFDGDLPWDTSQVTSMKGMFERAYFFNADLSNFDTSNVISMDTMFHGASAFNRDLPWDTSKVISMRSMFYAGHGRTSSFNGDISSFDTSKVTDMVGMFARATSFNQDVSHWDVESVRDMRTMFSGATLFSQSLCPWGEHYSEPPSWKYEGMFQFTNCASEGDPQGPYTNWCAATCNKTESLFP